jgi:hypothetical protein
MSTWWIFDVELGGAPAANEAPAANTLIAAVQAQQQ